MFFGMDIILNFRTTFHHPTTGEEISNKKQIVKSYLLGTFFLDLVSTIPFDIVANWFMDADAETLQLTSMLKTMRVFRLSKLIAFLNATEEIKLNL